MDSSTTASPRPARQTVLVLGATGPTGRQDLSNFHGGSISRADVAKFVLEQLKSDTWLRRTLLITW